MNSIEKRLTNLVNYIDKLDDKYRNRDSSITGSDDYFRALNVLGKIQDEALFVKSCYEQVMRNQAKGAPGGNPSRAEKGAATCNPTDCVNRLLMPGMNMLCGMHWQLCREYSERLGELKPDAKHAKEILREYREKIEDDEGRLVMRLRKLEFWGCSLGFVRMHTPDARVDDEVAGRIHHVEVGARTCYWRDIPRAEKW